MKWTSCFLLEIQYQQIRISVIFFNASRLVDRYRLHRCSCKLRLHIWGPTEEYQNTSLAYRRIAYPESAAATSEEERFVVQRKVNEKIKALRPCNKRILHGIAGNSRNYSPLWHHYRPRVKTKLCIIAWGEAEGNNAWFGLHPRATVTSNRAIVSTTARYPMQYSNAIRYVYLFSKLDSVLRELLC